jgi:hypothetical protein
MQAAKKSDGATCEQTMTLPACRVRALTATLSAVYTPPTLGTGAHHEHDALRLRAATHLGVTKQASKQVMGGSHIFKEV